MESAKGSAMENSSFPMGITPILFSVNWVTRLDIRSSFHAASAKIALLYTI